MFNYVSENKIDLSRIIICQQSFKDKLNFSLFKNSKSTKENMISH